MTQISPHDLYSSCSLLSGLDATNSIIKSGSCTLHYMDRKFKADHPLWVRRSVVQEQQTGASNLKHRLRQVAAAARLSSSLRLHINMFALLAVAQSEGTHTASLYGCWAKRSQRQTYVHWQPGTLEDGDWQLFNLSTLSHIHVP